MPMPDEKKKKETGLGAQAQALEEPKGKGAAEVVVKPTTQEYRERNRQVKAEEGRQKTLVQESVQSTGVKDPFSEGKAHLQKKGVVFSGLADPGRFNALFKKYHRTGVSATDAAELAAKEMGKLK